MKLFIDSSDIKEIEKYAWLVDGITLNQTLISRENMSYPELIERVNTIIDGHISLPINAAETDDIISQAVEYAEISNKIVSKISMTENGLKAVKELSKKNIKTNVTLVFSSDQVLLAAKAGASYVSIFVGRLDDKGYDGMRVVKDSVEILYSYDFDTEIIVASIRNPMHVVKAAKAKAHIATIPPKVLSAMFKHELTDAGIEKFENDWSGYKVKNSLTAKEKIYGKDVWDAAIERKSYIGLQKQ